jgi:hypothetical protein
MSRKNFRHRKEQRREDAIERQEAYDASTTQTKIENCHARRGESKKELHRLHHG